MLKPWLTLRWSHNGLHAALQVLPLKGEGQWPTHVYLTSIMQSLTAQCRFACLFQPRKVRRALRTDQSAVNSTLMPNCTPRMHFNDVNIINMMYLGLSVCSLLCRSLRGPAR